MKQVSFRSNEFLLPSAPIISLTSQPPQPERQNFPCPSSKPPTSRFQDHTHPELLHAEGALKKLSHGGFCLFTGSTVAGLFFDFCGFQIIYRTDEFPILSPIGGICYFPKFVLKNMRVYMMLVQNQEKPLKTTLIFLGIKIRWFFKVSYYIWLHMFTVLNWRVYNT